MIKKHVIEINGTEIELTPEQCQQLRDDLLRLCPVDSTPIQPLMPPPFRWEPEVTCGQTACNFRELSVWQ